MPSRLHVGFFTNTYKPNVNGVARSVSIFRNELSALGHNVFVFAQDAGSFQDEEPFIFRYPGVSLPGVDYSLTVPASPFITTLLPHLKLSIIHSHHPVLLGATAAAKAAELGLPLVFTFHTQYDEYSHYIPVQQNIVKGLIAEWLVHYLRRCHHIVTPSDSVRQMLEANGVHGPMSTVATGVELARFQQADGGPLRRLLHWEDRCVLVAAGRLAPEKNWRTLLLAVAAVMELRPSVRLLLLGDGPQRRELEQLTRTRGIADRVRFVGVVPFDDMPASFKAGDLFVFASVTETQGLVTMEAMAAGLAVAAVDGTGTRDLVVPGVTGLLVPNQEQMLAAAVMQLVDDEPLRRAMGNAGAVAAQSFDSRRQAERLLAVYEQAADDHQRGQTVQAEDGPISDRFAEYLRRLRGRGDDADGET